MTGEPWEQYAAQQGSSAPPWEQYKAQAAPDILTTIDRNIQGSTQRILNAFGYGFKEGVGEQPFTKPEDALAPDTVKFLKQTGIFHDYSQGMGNYWQDVFEGVIRHGAAAMEEATRLGAGVISAPLQAAGQALEETGVVPKGQATGTEGLRGAATDMGAMLAMGPLGEMSAFRAAQSAQDAAQLQTELARARASGVIAEGEAGFHDAVPVTPENQAARIDAAKETGAPAPEPLPPPADIHELAHRIEPEAIDKLQSLQADKDEARADLAAATDEKAAAKAQKAITVADEQQRELIPAISDAYRQAQDMMPEPKTPESAQEGSTAPPAAEGTKTPRYGALRPVEGTGELQIRALSEGVEATAIAKDLTDNFGDLPEYQRVSMAEQAQAAADLIANDYERAKAIAMGQKQAPKGVLPESVFVAVEKQALATGDVETLRDLATSSRLSTEATTMGQRIRTLGERDKESPVGAIQEVQQARAADLAKRSNMQEAQKATVLDIKRAMRSAASPVNAWQEFINTITCK